MKLLLIPVANALPAICEHFDRYPDDDAPVSDEEHRQLTELAVRYVRVSVVDWRNEKGGVSFRVVGRTHETRLWPGKGDATHVENNRRSG